MHCVLCASAEQDDIAVSVSSYRVAKKNSKNKCLKDHELGHEENFPGQKLAHSLCQLLDLPSEPFEEKFLQPNILFCPSCILFVVTVKNLFDQLEQLQKQLSEVKGQVIQRVLEATAKEDNGSSFLQHSTYVLRNEISRAIQLQHSESESVLDDLMGESAEAGAESEQLQMESPYGQMIVSEGFIEDNGNDDIVFKEEIIEMEETDNSDSVVPDWSLYQNVQFNPELEVVNKSNQVLKVCLTRLEDYDSEFRSHMVEKSKKKPLGEKRRRKSRKHNKESDEPKVKKIKMRKSTSAPVEKNISCTFPDCQEKFKTLFSRRIHLRKVHSALPPPLQCPHCPKTYRYERHLQTHVRIHTGEKPFVCEVCGRAFRNESYLKDHQIIHTAGEPPYPCPECPKAYYSSEALRYHSVTHTGQKSFMCELCSQSFVRKIELTNHQTKFHSTELNLKQFKCKFCSKVLIDRFYLRLHEKKHAGELEYKCEVCGLLCDRPSHLRVHMTSHTHEKNFECPNSDCDKTFKYKGQLTIHLRDHTGERNYKCETCSRAFKISEQLKRHVAVLHSGLTPLKCPLCGEGFPIRKYLNRHTEKHRLGKIPTPQKQLEEEPQEI